MITFVIPGQCRTDLREYYQGVPLEAISEEDWLILKLTVITTFQLVKKCHQFTSLHIHEVACSNKTASAFPLFCCLFAIKFSNNA